MVTAHKKILPPVSLLEAPCVVRTKPGARAKNDPTFKPATLKGSTQTKERGQFYTVANPFNHWLFQTWFDMIPKAIKSQKPLLEPFAGSNNLVKMMEDIYGPQNWACYDIAPSPDNQAPSHPIATRDTFKSFPEGHRVAITNPPYLYKGSAKKQGLPFPDSEHDDLYKHALKALLDNVDFVAAIVPASFLTSDLFHDRLLAVVSMTQNLFENTTCPVCLALFVPTQVKKNPKNFVLCRGEKPLGWHLDFLEHKKRLLATPKTASWTLNDPNGSLAVHALDSKAGRSIRFVRGEDIHPSLVKSTGRALIRVGGLPQGIDRDRVIEEANRCLAAFRNMTHDVHLTACLELRKDGDYRRRLPFTLLRSLLDEAVAAVSASK